MPVVNFNKSSKIAISGICASLSLVIMLMSSVIPVASIALPALAGCVLIPVVAIASIKYAYLVYAVVSTLSLFLVADKEAMLIYILFFGYYPVLFATIEKIRNKFLSYAVKLLIFNFCAIADYFIITFVFMIPQESLFNLNIAYSLLILLLTANLVFLLYDNALKRLIGLYFMRFHHVLVKFLKN